MFLQGIWSLNLFSQRGSKLDPISVAANYLIYHNAVALWQIERSKERDIICKFWPVGKLLSCRKMYFKRHKICGLKYSVLEKFKAQMKILSSTHNLLLEICLSANRKLQLPTPSPTFSAHAAATSMTKWGRGGLCTYCEEWVGRQSPGVCGRPTDWLRDKQRATSPLLCYVCSPASPQPYTCFWTIDKLFSIHRMKHLNKNNWQDRQFWAVKLIAGKWSSTQWRSVHTPASINEVEDLALSQENKSWKQFKIKKKLHDKLAYFGDQLTQCPIDVF